VKIILCRLIKVVNIKFSSTDQNHQSQFIKNLQGTHSYDDYVYTSEKYKPVSKSSPLFSIDCEMCYNEDGEMEPMWLALVNENLECVYETFIKPKKRIRNYLTQ